MSVLIRWNRVGAFIDPTNGMATPRAPGDEDTTTLAHARALERAQYVTVLKSTDAGITVISGSAGTETPHGGEADYPSAGKATSADLLKQHQRKRARTATPRRR